MGFLKKFLKNTVREGEPVRQRSSFQDLTDDELQTHLRIKRYGHFQLTDAVRPSYHLDVVPDAGYRHDLYHDRESGIQIPVLMASASKEHLLDLFFDLLEPLGDEVDAVLETSHHPDAEGHSDLYREQIELPILKSTLYGYEEMLLNDGCTGIAVLNPQMPLEVQFDEHKLLILYGHDLTAFETILDEHRIPRCEDMRFITEAEHVHSSKEEYSKRFDMLTYELGIDI